MLKQTNPLEKMPFHMHIKLFFNKKPYTNNNLVGLQEFLCPFSFFLLQTEINASPMRHSLSID